MLIGYNFASDGDSLNPHMVDVGKIKRVNLFQGVFDELMVDNGNNFTYDTTKQEWRYESVLLARFQGNLNAGNVDFTNMTVADIVVKKRKMDDLTGWQRVAKTPYDKNNIKTYEFYDDLSESFQEYEYAFVPVTSQGIEGDYIKETVFSEFEDMFMIDKDNKYKLRYNINYGSSERVTENALFQPLGSKYPIVVSNGMTNYEQGSVDTLVLSDKSLLKLHPKEETKYRKQLVDFLTNNKPKILKNGNGDFYMIKVIGNPQINKLNELSGALANVSFSWVEISNIDENSLLRNGLLDKSVTKR